MHSSQVVLALNADDEGEDIVIVDGEATLLPSGTVDATHAPFVEKYARLMDRIGTTPVAMAASYTQAIQIMPRRFLPA